MSNKGFTKFAGLLILAVLLLTPISNGNFNTIHHVEAQTSKGDLWGYVHLNGVKLTPSNAAALTGKYPIEICFYYSYSDIGNQIRCEKQTLTGYNSLYYSAKLPANWVRMELYVKGVYRTCGIDIVVSAGRSTQADCNHLPFASGAYSLASLTTNDYNLTVCAPNATGRTIYATLYRPAFYPNGASGPLIPSALWRYQKAGDSKGCASFNNMDGAGPTYAKVSYSSVASLLPIRATTAEQQRTTCATITDMVQLCDQRKR